MEKPNDIVAKANPEKLWFVVASLIVWRRSDNRCLIMKRAEREKQYPGLYGVTGGKLQWSDLSADRGAYSVIEYSMVREAKEEANVAVKPGFRYLGDKPFTRGDGQPVALLRFAAEYDSGEIVLEEGAFTDFKWVTAEEAERYPCIPGLPDEIRKAVGCFAK